MVGGLHGQFYHFCGADILSVIEIWQTSCLAHEMIAFGAALDYSTLKDNPSREI
jgi:hypothetical protein